MTQARIGSDTLRHDGIACAEYEAYSSGDCLGDPVICEDDSDIPVASEWGLVTFSLMTLIGGSLIVRLRSAVF